VDFEIHTALGEPGKFGPQDPAGAGGPAPETDDVFQPLPDFDNVVVPETQPYRCTQCRQIHQAKLVGMRPLGNMQLQLQYRADICPNTPIDIKVVEGGPVVREAHDEDMPQVPEPGGQWSRVGDTDYG
jgi:hypothetical protein